MMASTSLFTPQILHATSRTEAFFCLKEINKRWWFLKPNGEKFWSIGINHFDSETLRYEESGKIWEEKYGKSNYLMYGAAIFVNGGNTFAGMICILTEKTLLNYFI